MLDFQSFCQAVDQSPSVFLLQAYGLERQAALAKASDSSSGTSSGQKITKSSAAPAAVTDARSAKDPSSHETRAAKASGVTVSFGGVAINVDEETLRRDGVQPPAAAGGTVHTSRQAPVRTPSTFGLHHVGSDKNVASIAATSVSGHQALRGQADALNWSTDSPIPGDTSSLSGSSSGLSSSGAHSGRIRGNLGLAASGKVRSSARLEKLVVDELDDDAAPSAASASHSSSSSPVSVRHKSSTFSTSASSNAPSTMRTPTSANAPSSFGDASGSGGSDTSAMGVMAGDSESGADGYVISKGPRRSSNSTPRIRTSRSVSGDQAALSGSRSGGEAGSNGPSGSGTPSLPRSADGTPKAHDGVSSGLVQKPVLLASSSFAFSASDAALSFGPNVAPGSVVAPSAAVRLEHTASPSQMFGEVPSAVSNVRLDHVGFSRAGAIAGLAVLSSPARLVVCSEQDNDVAIMNRRSMEHSVPRRGAIDVQARDPSRQRPIVGLFYTDSSPMHCAVSANGKSLAVALASTAINRYDLGPNRPNPALLHSAVVNATAFSPTGRLLAAATDDGPCVVWSLRQVATASLVFNDHEAAALCICFDPSGSDLVLSGSADCTARLWRASTGKTAWIAAHPTPVVAVCFDGDGAIAASLSTTLLQLTAVESGNPLCSLPCVASPQLTLRDASWTGSAVGFRSVTFLPSPNPQTRVLAVGTTDRLLHILGVADEVGANGHRNARFDEELHISETRRVVTAFSNSVASDDTPSKSPPSRPEVLVYCGDAAGNVYRLTVSASAPSVRPRSIG